MTGSCLDALGVAKRAPTHMAPLTLPARPEPVHALFQLECPPVTPSVTLWTTHPLGTGDRLPDSKLSCLDGQDMCEGPERQAAEGLEHQNADLEITVSAKRGGAKSGARMLKRESASENCELLDQVIDAWRDLNPSAKALIAKMVKELKD